jgi:hypothetical protein
MRMIDVARGGIEPSGMRSVSHRRQRSAMMLTARYSEQPFSKHGECRVSLEVPLRIHDIFGVANGPFARAKEIRWPIGKTRKGREERLAA